jgi:hypothetical protein
VRLLEFLRRRPGVELEYAPEMRAYLMSPESYSNLSPPVVHQFTAARSAGA